MYFTKRASVCVLLALLAQSASADENATKSQVAEVPVVAASGVVSETKATLVEQASVEEGNPKKVPVHSESVQPKEATVPSEVIPPPVAVMSSDVVAPTTTVKPVETESYSMRSALEDLNAIKWESLGAVAGVTALGLNSWNWGSSGFHVNNENWFGKATGSGGADKLGHAFTSYALTNVFAERLQEAGRSPERAALSAGLLTSALMLYVEAFDGVSGDHGFSYEDVVMNSLGVGLAYLRQTNPRFKSLVDYRMEYKPSGYKGFRPLSDYEGQKYLLALKLSGVESLKNTPLRYLELQTGYYARGFSKAARNDGHSRGQYGFVGIGVNLSELFFGAPSVQDKPYEKWGRSVFEHIQLPYTATRLDKRL